MTPEPTAIPAETHRRLSTLRTDIAKGRIPAFLYNDDSVWQLERERLFAKSWCFLAHESEVPNPGDYVLRPIADSEAIVVRDQEGGLHAFLNMCRHRGTPLCKADMGNASHFRCSYHGWVYRNDGTLAGVPYAKAGYDGQFDRGQFGLVELRTERYLGLVFATMNAAAEPLIDYFGGFEFYLDLFLKHGAAGSEVYGPPDRWVASADWKICAENFCGDGYHTPVAHEFGYALGHFPASAKTQAQGWAVCMPGHGHGLGLAHSPQVPPFAGHPPEQVAQIRAALSDEQTAIFELANRTLVGTLFPNLSFLMQPFSMDPPDAGIRFCCMRLWHPLAAGKIQVWSWCLVPRESTPEHREAMYRAYTLCFGQAGTFEQDDFENWTGITRAAGSTLGRQLYFPYEMGLHRDPVADWPGPGVAMTPYLTDNNFRNMWDRWLDYVEE
jgi:3-phenylpropionate/trans-cinnamate dioxygenase alpha subunit